MSEPENEIPQRDLRNEVGRILREVSKGARFRVTVRGRPVADLVPVGVSRRFVSREDVKSILQAVPLDPGFTDEVESVLSGTIEEL